VAAPSDRTPIVTVPAYLAAVRSIHGLGVRDLARTLRVSPSVVRRWLRGTLVPSFRRVKGMTATWGGDADLLALGAALQRYCRASGVPLADAVAMVRSGRRTRPDGARPGVPRRDRRQLSLPIAP